jgi:hypothetical protein
MSVVDKELKRIKQRIEEKPTISTQQQPDDKRLYSIWSEGYAATGDFSGATYHGDSYGKGFRDAVYRYAQTNISFSKDLNLKELTLWGCKLYDNESDARRTFG